MRFAPRLLAAAALGLPIVSHAGPSDYVSYPYVEYGEREIDFKYGTAKAKDANGGERESEGSLALGYGATQWWFTEAYLKYHKVAGGKAGYDAFELENKVQLPKERRVEGYELKVGQLFQFYTGPLTWNANLLLARVVRAPEAHATEMGYQLQARYPLGRGVDVGVQAFGEMGKWNHWEPHDGQNHRIGPAVFGKVKLEGRQAIKYNAAFLFGETTGSLKNMFRVQAE